MTKQFFRAVAERSLSTAAQSMILALGADQLNALEADWVTVLGFGAGGAVLSILKSFAAQGISGDGPGFGHAEKL